MRVLCCPDSFKESMSAVEAAAALARGVERVWPDADVVSCPLADGGEGTVSALMAAMGGELLQIPTSDALGNPIVGTIGFVPERSLAVVEVASACGIELIPPDRRDAEAASTFGVGQLLLAALELGAREVIVGLGGSATTDAGSGMLAALGVRFRDADGVELSPGGASLERLAEVDISGLDARLAGIRWRAACDVDNPLLGSEGAAVVFAPQKGASPESVVRLDAALSRWADVTEDALGVSVRDLPGAGAAGGLGAAFVAFLAADLTPGIDLVLDAVGFESLVGGVDVVFTGEGSVDSQSSSGKVPWGVARRAAQVGVPVIVFGGRVDPDVEIPGVAALVSILHDVTDLSVALEQGTENLERAAATVCRLLGLGGALTHYQL